MSFIIMLYYPFSCICNCIEMDIYSLLCCGISFSHLELNYVCVLLEDNCFLSLKALMSYYG